MLITKSLLGLLFVCFSLAESNDFQNFFRISLSQNLSSKEVTLFEKELFTVTETLTYPIFNQSLEGVDPLFLTCWMNDPNVAKLLNWTDISLASVTLKERFSRINITMEAKRLGGSKLFCGVRKKDNNDTSNIFSKVFLSFLIVKRVPTVQEVVFRFVVMFFVIFLTFVMGCGLDRTIIKNYLKKPVSPAIGFGCQFVFMPLVSFGLAKLTNIENAFGFGLLTIGCSPGGGASNVWTILFGGDLNLSMTMTFISSCSALFMMPFWLFVLGRFFLDPTVVQVPYLSIGLNLLQVVIPVGFGMLFRWKFEKKADILIKKVKIMGLLFVIFILTFGTYANFYIYKLMGDYPFLLPIGASLPWLGFVFGFLMSLVTRRTKNQAIAISIETGFQNIGIAILILKFSMPQPGGDLGAVMPIIVALFTPLPLYFGLLFLTIKRKCCEKKKKSKSQEMDSVNNENRDTLLNEENEDLKD